MTTGGSVPDVPRPEAPAVSVPSTGAALGAAPVSPPVEPTPNSDAHTPFTWSGSPWDIAGTCVFNIVLTILTLGIYGFWGRTEIRRRLWGCVRLHGEPLVYHGTPHELMRGFFAILAVVLVPLFVIGTIVVVFFGQGSAVFGLYQIGLFLVVYPILAAVAFYRARRYRLARTSWRGMRGSLTGSSLGYSAFSWLTLSAYPLTLGWIAPYRAVELQRVIVNDTTLGSAPLQFEGRAAPLYKRYTMLWFGTLVLWAVAIGIIGVLLGRNGLQPGNPFWWASIRSRDIALVFATVVGAIVIWSLMSSFYYARLYNYLAHATLIRQPQAAAGAVPVRFRLDVTGKRIIWLYVTNALITYLSLYVLKPVATARAMKYYVEHLSVVGPFEPPAIGQNPNVADTAGEGLAQAFDLDAF